MKNDIKVTFSKANTVECRVVDLDNCKFGKIIFVPEGCETFKVGDLVVKVNNAMMDLTNGSWTTFGYNYGDIRVEVVTKLEIKVLE